MYFQRSLTYLSLSVLLAGLAACDGSKRKSASGVAGKVHVGQLGTSATLSALSATSKWEDVTKGTGHYSWAKVDGLKVQVLSIFGKSGDQTSSFTSFSAPKTLELGGGVDTVTIQEDISVPVGTYTEVGLSFKNQISLKAFCRTDDKALYTTAAGVKECAAPSSCNPGDALPSDYDYYAYDFMLPGPHYEGTLWEGNKLTFSIAEDDTPNLALLMDTSYIVSCADSDAAIDSSAESGKMAPFSWMITGGKKMSDYYKGSEGNFGVGYLPLFTYLSTDVNEALPVGETYAASGDETHVPAGIAPVDLFNSMITTVAFDANDNIVAARSRNFDAAHGTSLEQGWSGYSTDGSNSYTMMNGEHWGGTAADFSEARWLQDRKIEGFARSSDYVTRQTINVVDGPDCGKNLGEKSQPCQTGGAVTTYWKRIQR